MRLGSFRRPASAQCYIEPDNADDQRLPVQSELLETLRLEDGATVMYSHADETTQVAVGIVAVSEDMSASPSIWSSGTVYRITSMSLFIAPDFGPPNVFCMPWTFDGYYEARVGDRVKYRAGLSETLNQRNFRQAIAVVVNTDGFLDLSSMEVSVTSNEDLVIEIDDDSVDDALLSVANMLDYLYSSGLPVDLNVPMITFKRGRLELYADHAVRVGCANVDGLSCVDLRFDGFSVRGESVFTSLNDWRVPLGTLPHLLDCRAIRMRDSLHAMCEQWRAMDGDSVEICDIPKVYVHWPGPAGPIGCVYAMDQLGLPVLTAELRAGNVSFPWTRAYDHFDRRSVAYQFMVQDIWNETFEYLRRLKNVLALRARQNGYLVVDVQHGLILETSCVYSLMLSARYTVQCLLWQWGIGHCWKSEKEVLMMVEPDSENASFFRPTVLDSSDVRRRNMNTVGVESGYTLIAT